MRYAFPLAVLMVLGIALPVLAQETIPSDDPYLGMLATAAGLSAVIAVIVNLMRGVMEPHLFDQWAPLIAVVIGVVLSILYVVVTGPVNGGSIVQAALVGLFAGGFSQNVNTVVRRAIAAPPTSP